MGGVCVIVAQVHLFDETDKNWFAVSILFGPRHTCMRYGALKQLYPLPSFAHVVFCAQLMDCLQAITWREWVRVGQER